MLLNYHSRPNAQDLSVNFMEYFWSWHLQTLRGPEAVEALGTCVALRPDTPWASSTRGLVRGLLGQFELAETDFHEALTVAPEFRPARLNRGYVHFLQRREAEALTDWEAVLEPPNESILIEAAYYGELAECSTTADERRRCEELALTFLRRAISLYQLQAGAIDEFEQIRIENAFHDELRARPEFQQL